MNPQLLQHDLTVSQPSFDAFFEVEPLLLHSIDAQGTLLNVSAAWARLLGYEREALIGRRMVDTMTPRSRAYALTTGLPLFFTRGHVSNISYEFVRADGRPLPVLVSSAALRDDEGRFVKSLAVITDDRRASYAERALEAQQRRDPPETEAFQQMLERFSHHTRTPLNAIFGFVALMKQNELSGAQAGRLGEILKAAGELRSLLDALLKEVDTGPAARTEPAPADLPPPDSREPLPLAPMRVLLADNDATHQDALRELLRAGGHDVVTVANGYEAIEALFAGPIDLALIDLDLPGLSGAATVSQIRNSGRSFRDIPVIACTEAETAPAGAALLERGIDGTLAKPANRSSLDHAMRRALQAKSPA